MTENKEGHRWELNTCVNCGLQRKTVNKPKKGALGYSRDNFQTYNTRAGICLKP